jgi:hypothetical protein
MVKMTFSSENKVKSDFDFPKLYLDHGERARIVCIETEPEVEFVHTLKAPVVMNGELVMETVKAKDGSTSEKPKTDFVGRHICFGLPNVLFDKTKGGKDPENCPTCAEAQQHDYIGPAIRRFAMHVIQYRTQPGGFKVQVPFQAELVVWTFTDKMYTTLTDIAEEHGDLRAKDLLLGPCENKMFQNFDVQVGGGAEWLASPENTKFVQTLYAENKLADLTPAIARKVTRDMALEDIQKVHMKHRQAYGGGGSSMEEMSSPVGGGLDLEGLLGAGSSPAAAVTPDPAPAAPAAEASAPALDGLLDTSVTAPVAPAEVDAPAAPAPAVTEAEVPAPVPTVPTEEKKTLDFNSLLDGL